MGRYNNHFNDPDFSKSYVSPAHMKEGFIPFNPLELSKNEEKIVCRDNKRKYTNFYVTGVYGGISTGYLVGCCLRCIFCWVNRSRDFPDRYGKFYSSEDVFKRLLSNARRKKVKKLRISGGEPTLCKDHLINLLKLVSGTSYLFILETNGILLGGDPGYSKELSKFKNIHIRVSLKASFGKGFQRRTGAIGEYYDLPFQAIENLLKDNVSFHVASMSDSRLMSDKERKELYKKLHVTGYRDYLEEESCDPYDTAIFRLKEAGYPDFFIS